MVNWAPPKRSLGQNFLCDGNVIRRIADAIGAGCGDLVFEIGPGRGALTQELITRNASLIALEKDRHLAWQLHHNFPHIAVVYGDALRFAWEGVGRQKKIRIVGNLPYNIASVLLWDIVWRSQNWERMVFLVQKEVGERIVASPRTAAYGALGVWIQNFCHAEMIGIISPHVFWPKPKVDSAIVRFWPKADVPQIPEHLSRLVHLAFQKRRKQWGNILRPWWDSTLETWFDAVGISRSARPEELSPLQFRELAGVLASLWNAGKCA